MQNRCAMRQELELQSFQRWIASSCLGGRGWVYHGELRCHSRLASQNRSTTKSSYGRITSGMTSFALGVLKVLSFPNFLITAGMRL